MKLIQSEKIIFINYTIMEIRKEYHLKLIRKVDLENQKKN